MFILAFCFWPFAILSFIALLVTIFIILQREAEEEYKSTSYYQSTKLSYTSLQRNAGFHGEYLTYRQLKHMEADGAKFLFNLYIPKNNGKTTEIDLIMICPKGLFVFESKNYNGWIFGNETQENWCQTLPAGRRGIHKTHFYNPIMQNNFHIKHLCALIGTQLPTWSIIAFSDRCKLKNAQVRSNYIRVINRRNVAAVVSEICAQTPADVLSANHVTMLYNKLYPFTQVNAATKAQHIANIHKKA